MGIRLGLSHYAKVGLHVRHKLKVCENRALRKCLCLSWRK